MKMINTKAELIEYLFELSKDTIQINPDLNGIVVDIHRKLLDQPKIKKQIKGVDIIWIDDSNELINRHKGLIEKFDIKRSALFPFKINDLLQWLFDGASVEIPELFLYYKKEIDGILWYLHNSFLKNIRFVVLLNEHGNSLYNNDTFQVLKFYKFLIQQQKLNQSQLMQYFPNKNYRKEFVARMNEIQLADTGNAKSLYELLLSGALGKNYNTAGIQKLIESTYGEVVDTKTDTTTLEEINNILSSHEDSKRMQDSKVITTLNQQVIDELQLTIFDVRTIKAKNLILYIFIDKDNNKRYYYEPFSYTFFISMNPSIIQNDYLVDYDPQIHIPYTMTNYDQVTKFKFAITDLYKKHMVKFLK
jgi:hypothetical protein